MRPASLHTAILCLVLLCPAATGQSHSSSPGAIAPKSVQEGAALIFGAVEEGLRGGDDRAFAAYFSSTVSLNVRGSSPGYYSANQAGQVLRQFLSGRKSPAFRFTTVDAGEHPWATGSLTGAGQGDRVQVYVGLTKERSGWVISQFNIY